MSKESKEIVGFTFQEIPLEEALNVVLAGDGNYAEVKQALLEKLPTLAPDKAFAFGLPNNKEVPEDQRRGLCMAINSTLKKASLNWRITYTNARKMFVCIPRQSKKSATSSTYTPRSKWNKHENEDSILRLWKEGLSVNKIAKETGVDIQRLRYLCYQRHPRKHGKLTQSVSKPIEKSNGKMSAAHLVELAKTVLNYSGDFKDRQGKVIRKAISIVGLNDLGLHPKEIAPLVGLSYEGVYFNGHTANTKFGSSEINTLRKAVN